MRRGPTTACLAVAAVLALSGCFGADGRDRVEDYVNQANQAQSGAGADELERATSIYRRFAAGEINVGRARPRLVEAERTVAGILERLKQLDPPAEATRLHARLVRLFELNAEMARETALFARFLPMADAASKPLDRANRQMSAGLQSADPGARARALERFGRELRSVARRLRELQPPAVLTRAHRNRLRRLEKVRSLAAELASALRSGDGAAVAARLRRFSDAVARDESQGLDRASVRRYRQRYRELDELAREVRREQSRLRRELLVD